LLATVLTSVSQSQDEGVATYTSVLLQSVLYHFVAFALYLSASVTLIVSISRDDIRNYRDGHYYEPFLAAGVCTGNGVCL
jgi:hypothetical protein